MNSKEINHAAGLVPALLAKARDLRDQADALDEAKEGRSLMAASLRLRAQECERRAHDLRAAIDAERWLA